MVSEFCDLNIVETQNFECRVNTNIDSKAMPSLENS